MDSNLQVQDTYTLPISPSRQHFSHPIFANSIPHIYLPITSEMFSGLRTSGILTMDVELQLEDCSLRQLVDWTEE